MFCCTHLVGRRPTTNSRPPKRLSPAMGLLQAASGVVRPKKDAGKCRKVLRRPVAGSCGLRRRVLRDWRR
eukprot:15467252-Alexandrium_andersonii.AAC.1